MWPSSPKASFGSTEPGTEVSVGLGINSRAEICGPRHWGGSTPHMYARRPQPGEGPEEPGRAELVLPSLGLGGGKEAGDESVSPNASPSWVDCRLPHGHWPGLSGWTGLGFPPAEPAEERDEMLRRGETAQEERTQRSSCTHRKQRRQGHWNFKN